MNILFKKQFVEKILSGEKTVTRRTNPKWAKVENGAPLYAKVGYCSKPFARLRVLTIWREAKPGQTFLGANRGDGVQKAYRFREAVKEGFECWEDFSTLYTKINGKNSMNEPCYRIEFEVVEEGV